MPAAGQHPHMPDALSGPQQKLFENARRALAQGNFAYVLAACETILSEKPEWLPARRLQRLALVKKIPPLRRAWMRRALNCLSGLTLAATATWAGRAGGAKTPRERFGLAERHLLKKPYSTAALQMLADAAGDLGWGETAVFAYETIRELEPRNRANLLALGETLLAAQRAAEALTVADTLLDQNPVDGAAQTLMRNASIAQTMETGNWATEGDFRTKLKKS